MHQVTPVDPLELVIESVRSSGQQRAESIYHELRARRQLYDPTIPDLTKTDISSLLAKAASLGRIRWTDDGWEWLAPVPTKPAETLAKPTKAKPPKPKQTELF